MNRSTEPERVDTVVIGAGQAGLSVGYHLARRGQKFVILETNERVGDSWRARWDSLKLFSPGRFDGLDGLPFPGDKHAFPTKDAMGDYLESYARHFKLDVRTDSKVTSLRREGDEYVVQARSTTFVAANVVIAMASYQKPRVPEFAADLDKSIVQMHSSDYRNLRQLRPGGVLLVGAGNSGSEIAMETVRGGHETWISGRHPGHIPWDIKSIVARTLVLRPLFRFVFHRVLTMGTPIGRKVRPAMISKGGPLIRVKPNDMTAAGVHRVGRTVAVQDRKPVLDNGEMLDVANVIWSTGYHTGHDWVELPIFDDHGEPHQTRGVVNGEPGMYFVGLHFLYAMSSSMIHGVGRDADYVANVIAKRDRRVRSPGTASQNGINPALNRPSSAGMVPMAS
jgi:putative flavoprotein involved in K+ transport